MADVTFNRQSVITFPHNDDIPDVVNGIEAGTMSVSELLLDGDISFGSSNSNKFEVTVFGLPDVANEKIYVYQIDDGVNVPIFTGYVDSCKKDRQSYYRDIVAYDALYYFGEVDIAVWWESFWLNTNVSTLKSLRDSLCNYMGIEQVNTSLFNDNYVITRTIEISSMKFIDMLTFICEMQLVNPNITRDGKLEYIKLYEPKNTVNVIGQYESDNTTFESFSTQKITGLLFTLENADAPIGYTASDVNIYHIDNNPFTFEKTNTELTDLAQRMYNIIKDITFVPFDLNMIVSNSSIKLGTKVITEHGNSIVTGLDLSGSLLVDQNIEFSGNEYLSGNQKSYNASYEAIKQKVKDIVVDTMGYFTFRNEQAVTVTDGSDVQLILITFTTRKNSLVELHAELRVDVETTADEVNDIYTDCVARIRYVVNDSEISNLYPTETWMDGKHTLHLLHAMEIEASATNTLAIYLNSEGGKISIPLHNFTGFLSGLSLVGDDTDWGKIFVTDNIVPVTLGVFGVDTTLTDELSITSVLPIKLTFNDTLSAVDLSDFVVSSISDNVGVHWSYGIESTSTTGGTITLNTTRAIKDTTIIITPHPNVGYVVDTITVTSTSGNVPVQYGDKITFVMPASDVVVKVTFKEG